MLYPNEMKESEISTNTVVSEVTTLNYRLLKLRSKIVANTTNISINNLHIFSMDNFPAVG